ncbi:hypothetical protein [Cerasicoccus fimbriatus]|uniref:hypothetical protein n=1 Tax=Cerasicoccus fimbriatus TaxID=3014554 RepID=UPI0022B57AEE|nr:hypothetical protein [Cerasicoccus sp. TK19100]
MSDEKRNLLEENKGSKGLRLDRIASGPVSARVFLNSTEKGQMLSATVSRSYRGQDGEWKNTNTYGSRDLLHLSSVAQRTHEYMENNREMESYNDSEKGKSPEEPVKDAPDVLARQKDKGRSR